MRILLTIFVLFLSTITAQAQNRWMTIENASTDTLMEFYASNQNQNSWGRDWLGQNVIYSGQNTQFDFDDGSGTCIWDMKALFADGSEIVWNQVDVCTESTWFVGAPAASTQNRWMTIENASNETLTEFYASSETQSSWGRDWLGQNVIYGGQTIQHDFDDGSGSCIWDMKAVFANGSETVWNQVNVCIESVWSVSPPAPVHNRWMTIENASNTTLTELYAANAAQTSWGNDWLGRSVIYGGQSIQLDFDDGSGYCLMDMRAVFADGSDTIWNQVDVCVESVWSASPPVAPTQNRWMTIENASNITLMEFYASSETQTSWGRDWLGQNVIYNGQSTQFDFDDGSGSCIWDMKAVFDDGSETVWNQVDVCVESVWSASPPVVQSDNHWMTIENISGYTVTEFYASNNGQSSWGRDWLGQNVLYSGQNLQFDFDDGSGYCIWDFKAVLANGAENYQDAINVCIESVWSIR